MTTVTASEARLKVRFDLSGEMARLKEMEDALAKLKEGMKGAGPGGTGGAPRSKDEKKEGEPSWQDIYTKVSQHILNPLDTALHALGAIPEVGPPLEKSIRVGMDVAENGLPLVQGFGRAILKSKGYEKGSIPERSLSAVLEGMASLTNDVAELRAKNDAIAPAWEAMKKMAMAQVLAGGVPGGKDIAEFGSAMLQIIGAQTALSRKVQRMSLEAVGGAGEALFEGLFR